MSEPLEGRPVAADPVQRVADLVGRAEEIQRETMSEELGALARIVAEMGSELVALGLQFGEHVYRDDLHAGEVWPE